MVLLSPSHYCSARTPRSMLFNCSAGAVAVAFKSDRNPPPCRCPSLRNHRKNQRISRNIYAQAKTVVAVSQNVKQFMVAEEHIEAAKITVIPLSYNFDLYEKPSAQAIEAIRLQYATSLLLYTVGRFTSLKRMNLIIECVDHLVKEGVDCKLIIVGQGPEEANLKQQVEAHALQQRVFFVGFLTNVLPYMAAADYYLHFSITEATCTTVKEAALVGTPVIVCEGVGDFDQYIKHKENSYVVSKADPVTDAVALLHEIYRNEPLRKQVGEQLRKTVVSFFAIERAMPTYKTLHDKVLNV